MEKKLDKGISESFRLWLALSDREGIRSLLELIKDELKRRQIRFEYQWEFVTNGKPEEG